MNTASNSELAAVEPPAPLGAPEGAAGAAEPLLMTRELIKTKLAQKMDSNGQRSKVDTLKKKAEALV